MSIFSVANRREIDDFMGDFLDRIRRAANDRIDEEFAEGFNEAAGICVDVLSKNIDGLMNQIKSDNYLSDQEQFLLSKLNALKAEAERELRDFWDNTGS